MNRFVICSVNNPEKLFGEEPEERCIECNSAVTERGCTNPDCIHRGSRANALFQTMPFR